MALKGGIGSRIGFNKFRIKSKSDESEVALLKYAESPNIEASVRLW